MQRKELENPQGIKALLKNYYDRVAKGGGWGDLLSENFVLSGTIARGSSGREAYVNNSFFKLVRGLEVEEMIAEGNTGFALVNYDVVSPKGKAFTSRVAELWKMKEGKLDSVAIYFDTAAFNESME
jgi:ketosteroid isomerase-like protein